MLGIQSKRAWEIVGSLAIVAVLSVPFVTGAKSGQTIYVDDNATGTENGSSAHPFNTIEEGLDAAESGDTVQVAKGTYEENITIPKGVKVVGAGRGSTTIKADKDDKVTVVMKDRSKLQGVTVKKGKVGVVVKEGARAEITDSAIVDNRHEGIVALKAAKNDDGKLSLVDVEVRDNGWSGIYSEKRKLVILESDIKENGKTGIFLEDGVKAWFDNNAVSGNRADGLYVKMGGSEVTIASGNTFRANRLSGVAVENDGTKGSVVVVRKSRLSENGNYGVAKLTHNGTVSANAWSGLSVQDTNTFFGNKKGNISPILK